MEHFWILWIVIPAVLFCVAFILADPDDPDKR